MSNLLPLTNVSKINFTDEENGNIKIKYLKGAPRIYRFNASTGVFNVQGSTVQLTKKPGDSLTIIPIAFQVFTDSILGEQYERMQWVELIFLNEALQVCSMLLHGYSVANLMSKSGELFYDDRNFCEVKLTISPSIRTSKSEEAKGAKYFIAEFSYELIGKEDLEKIATATKGLEFFRESIYTVEREIHLSKNYGIPTEIKKQLAAAKKPEIEEAETVKDAKPTAAKQPEKEKAAAT